MSRFHWVSVEHSDALNKTEWKEYIQKSYDLVFNKLSAKEKLKLK